jgi:hypothetical protein
MGINNPLKVSCAFRTVPHCKLKARSVCQFNTHTTTQITATFSHNTTFYKTTRAVVQNDRDTACIKIVFLLKNSTEISNINNRIQLFIHDTSKYTSVLISIKGAFVGVMNESLIQLIRKELKMSKSVAES